MLFTTALLAVTVAPGRAAPPAARTGASLGWVELNIRGPPNGSAYGFAWGTPKGQTPYALFFGGRMNATQGVLSNETWVLKNGSWSRVLTHPAPPPSRYPVLAWDPPLNAFVLFGGSDTRYMNDTWIFSGGTWKQLHIPHSPPIRRSAGMAYDPALSELILWGGHNSFPHTGDSNQSAYYMLNDTWAFRTGGSHATWVNLTATAGNAPPPVSEPSLAWDPPVAALIEFGGYNQGLPQHLNGKYHAYNSTWAFTGGKWSNLSLAHSPYVRDGAAIAFSPVLHELVLFGGQDEASPSKLHATDNDTWALAGSSVTSLNWSQIPTSRSPPRVDSLSMIWDAKMQRLLVFGGVGSPPFPGTKSSLYWYGGTWALR